MVFLTEGYTSPFFTFFVFIVLSATIKWGWRETAISAGIIIILFFLGGWAAITLGGAQLEVMRFLIRGTYLIVLSGVLIWFGINQQSMYLRRLKTFEWAEGGGPSELPVRQALEYTAARTGARQAAFAWWAREEPWIDLAILEQDRFTHERHGPGVFDDPVDQRLSGCPFIFDAARGRALIRRVGDVRRMLEVRHPLNPALTRRLGSESGLAVPVASDGHEGIIVASEIPGLCVDDLALAEHLGEEISAAFQRALTVEISGEAAAARTRLSFARDLHDSVIQLLAGTSFRLEGIRKSAAANRSVDAEVDALQQELSAEQRDLRGFIRQLRDGAARAASPGVCETLRGLLERMARQWNAQCRLVRCPEALRIPPQLEHDVHQLVREGIANAVRHGNADEISISLDAGETGLSLIVADNGTGFSVQETPGEVGAAQKPWSLNERVRELGGSLTLYSSPNGSRITISLPFGAQT
jgi:signal transduction histidine kinase